MEANGRGLFFVRALPKWRSAVQSHKRLWPYLKSERKLGTAIGLLLLGTIITSVLPPFLVKQIFDQALPRHDSDQVLVLSIGIVGLTFLAQIFTFYQLSLALTLRNRIRLSLTADLFQHVLRLPLPFFQSRDSGYITARVREDVAALDSVMTDRLLEMFSFGLRAILFCGLLFFIDAVLATMGMLLVGLTFIGVLFFSRAMKKSSLQASETSARSGGVLQEVVAGLPTVRSQAGEDQEAQRFQNAVEAETQAKAERDMLGLRSWRFIGVLGACGAYLTVAVGAYRILQGQSSIGALMAFFIFLQRLVGTTRNAFSLAPLIAQSMSSLDRVFQLMDEIPEASGPQQAPLPRLQGKIQFHSLNFNYDDSGLALQDINLEIQPGEFLTIVGRNGAGKSTLIQLLMRLHTPSRGHIRLDEVSLDQFPARWLRRHIGFVAADPFLFNRSIRENIRYGRQDASDEETLKAAEWAGCKGFVDPLPQGMDTVVGERGVRLSQGQKQRIALARVLLQNPPILILDEPVSSQDAESAAHLEESLRSVSKGRTTLLVTHRLPATDCDDRIVVLDRGKIVEVGSRRELLGRDGVFASLQSSALQSGTSER